MASWHSSGSQVRQERFDLGFAHCQGMALVEIQHELLDPMGIGLFRADGVMPQTTSVSHLIEQFWSRATSGWLVVRVHSAFVGFVTLPSWAFKCLIF